MELQYTDKQSKMPRFKNSKMTKNCTGKLTLIPKQMQCMQIMLLTVNVSLCDDVDFFAGPKTLKRRKDCLWDLLCFRAQYVIQQDTVFHTSFSFLLPSHLRKVRLDLIYTVTIRCDNIHGYGSKLFMVHLLPSSHWKLPCTNM